MEADKPPLSVSDITKDKYQQTVLTLLVAIANGQKESEKEFRERWDRETEDKGFAASMTILSSLLTVEGIFIAFTSVLAALGKLPKPFTVFILITSCISLAAILIAETLWRALYKYLKILGQLRPGQLPPPQPCAHLTPWLERTGEAILILQTLSLLWFVSSF